MTDKQHPYDQLLETRSVQDGAAAQGFDWPDMTGVWDKLEEEVAELKAAQTRDEQMDELGDLMFMLVNVARHLNLDPRVVLGRATAKFERRFTHVCAHMADAGLTMNSGNIEDMERYWNLAKRSEK